MIPSSPPAPLHHLEWIHPAQDPWRGDEATAIALLNNALHLTIPTTFDRCRTRQLFSDERIDAMVFGEAGVATDVVARTTHWPSTTSTIVLDCRFTQDGVSYAFLRPQVCGNWAVEAWPPASLRTVASSPGTGGSYLPSSEWSYWPTAAETGVISFSSAGRAAWMTTPPSSSTARIPEPSSLLTLLTFLIPFIRRLNR